MRRRLSQLTESTRELAQQSEALSRRIAAVERRARRTVADGGDERVRRLLERSQTARAEVQRIEMQLAQLDTDRVGLGARLARPVRRVAADVVSRLERMEDTVERVQARTLAIGALLDDVSAQAGQPSTRRGPPGAGGGSGRQARNPVQCRVERRDGRERPCKG